MTTTDGRSRGGKARAAKLTAAERSAIGKKGAAARWNANLPEAICGSPDRPLRIGDVSIQCYVLEDGTRVLSQGGFLEALGRHRRPTRINTELPPILKGNAISPFITDEVREKARPIPFRMPNGVRAIGYRADLLPIVCELYLQAADAGALLSSQRHIAERAAILVRGLAHTGIIALVDEVTGYQELRAKDALAQILEAFVAEEIQAYVRTFPNDYYREMFRLRGLEFPQDSVRRPQYFGHLTNDIVYRRLAPGVLDELKRVTLKDDDGRSKHKLFQRLTQNLGYPKLREHLGSVVTLMKLSSNWGDFSGKLERFHPRYGATLPLPLEFEEDDGRGL
ncbi:MAG: P63C domain-containing protein [Chloroflexi bacterium]|nr:P63C domain-containing protein [Chloroflexota bacterium]